jgi:hypothetical protein
MSLKDKAIRCSDCGTTFIFSAGEQEQFVSRGNANTPKRCPSCRAKKKMERYGDGDHNYSPDPGGKWFVELIQCER